MAVSESLPFNFWQLPAANWAAQSLRFRVVILGGVGDVLEVASEAERVEVVEANRLDEVVVADDVSQTNGTRTRGNVALGQKLLLAKRKRVFFSSNS